MVNSYGDISIMAGLEIGKSALKTQQKGLQVIGHNLANVNTEGYSRQKIILTENDSLMTNIGQMGTGVKVGSIIQYKNNLLLSKIRYEQQSLAWWEEGKKTLENIQNIFSEPSNSSLNESLSKFWASWQNLSLDPQSTANRAELLKQAEGLTGLINEISKRMDLNVTELNNEISSDIDELNSLFKQVANLNSEIIAAESKKGFYANDSRDERNRLLSKINELAGVKIVENPSGGVNVYINGINVVQDKTYLEIENKAEVKDGVSKNYLYFKGSDTKIEVTSGKIGGKIYGRDEIFTKYKSQLDEFTYNLIKNVNDIHTKGSGIVGYTQITSETDVIDKYIPLSNSESGLKYQISTGSFQINVKDSDGNVESYTVSIKYGITTLDSLAKSIGDELSGVKHVSAFVSSDNKLIITCGQGYTFTFSNDTTGVLSALGINTFFKGDNSGNIKVADTIKNNPNFIAASANGLPSDNQNAIKIAQLETTLTMNNSTITFNQWYQGYIGELGASISEAKTFTENKNLVVETLTEEYTAEVGVNMDEELTKMIQFQHAYNAAARIITSIDEMLDVLINRTGTVGR